jgi:hypothetical protein
VRKIAKNLEKCIETVKICIETVENIGKIFTPSAHLIEFLLTAENAEHAESLWFVACLSAAKVHRKISHRIGTDFEVCGLCCGGVREYISICIYTNVVL